tara:strand:- start:358 stop:1941 length:1584 start_codon:yes stop_codon:yes gene_type:complete
MGIPSYFSYIVKNHGSIIRKISALKNPVNNLYLDSNSIIYDVYRNIPVEGLTKLDYEIKIYEAISNKISEYIEKVKPQDNIFIAFDGVAPVAKLEQQRNRRYKSMFERELMKKNNPEYKEFGWDQTAITPGTNFMNNLGDHIRYYFNKNAHRFPQNIMVSDINDPGEGEHKIFEYIRVNEKTHKNKITIVYGLDADLIMLALNHLPVSKGIYLYRETPHFIKTVNSNLNPNEEYMLNIPELANAIADELSNYRKNNDKQRDNRLYDYIFICLFLGNDFMPHIPSVNIRTTGIEIMLNAYKETLGNTNEYLTNGKVIYWKNVRKLVEVLKRDEYENLINEYKLRRKMNTRSYDKETIEDKLTFVPIRNREKEEYINPFEKGWEHRYYRTLFDVEINQNRKKEICINYLEALEWTMKYYTIGCYDWNWHYKYNYPPLMKDLLEFMPVFETEFVLKKPKNPLKPLQQLSYVLPKSALHLLPDDIRKQLLDFYPEWYNTDCDFQWEFCKYFWESHVIMKTIKLDKLKQIIA